MKKLFLILVFLPLTSFAENISTSSQEIDGVKALQRGRPRALLCGGFSDADCFGRTVDSVCIKDTRYGTAGVCRQVSVIYEDETVTCRCF